MNTYEEIEQAVIDWAKARRIIPNATPTSQLMKAFEEMGELAAGEARNQMPKIEDSVGDVMVCLINYCALRNIRLVECLRNAYDEIKERKGTLMPNGIFVKEGA
jgi:NTP pyrophosphatase (non-canonical NTP hydrolase)